MSAAMRGRSAIVSFAALLLAVSLRVLVPTGWMPSPDGGFRIVPCVAAQPAPKAHGHHASGHSDKQKPHHQESGKDCAFAPLLAGAALPDAPPSAIAAFAPVVEPVAPAFAPGALPTGPPSPPPPATGPPHRA